MLRFLPLVPYGLMKATRAEISHFVYIFHDYSYCDLRASGVSCPKSGSGQKAGPLLSPEVELVFVRRTPRKVFYVVIFVACLAPDSAYYIIKVERHTHLDLFVHLRTRRYSS